MCKGRSEFVALFGSVYENSPWVAEQAFEHGADFDGVDQVAATMKKCVDNAQVDRQLELIRAHPDLAAAARPDALSMESVREQASAGLDRCTAEEYERFQSLNKRYSEKFGFPFVMAIRGRSLSEVLGAFTRRLDNDLETEFETALREIHAIARLRLKAMEDPP